MTVFRILGCLALGFASLGAAPQATAQNTFPDNYTFDRPTWICRTAEAFRDLETRLADSGTPGDLPCALITMDDVEDIMAPWISIIDEDGDLVEVRFLVERYMRLRPPDVPIRGGNTSRSEFIGWTRPDTLEVMTTF